MTEPNCELLFAYLRSLLYDQQVQPLDISRLDEPFQKLGKGLQYLEKAVAELKAYTEALSSGNLSVEPPPRENPLCGNLKNLHANLNHLTWQAQRVAEGDYTQNVSFLGEFSKAFNQMTAQLQEREWCLRQEIEIEKVHADMVDNYNQLLMELIARSEESIFVTSIDGQRVLYDSRVSAYATGGQQEIYQICRSFSQTMQQEDAPHSFHSFEREWEWEATDSEKRHYKIITGLMKWQGEQAYAHILREVTAEKRKEEQLEAEANHDTLTQIGNRRYFQERAQEMFLTDKSLIFCYCDLDHLKLVNDHYGHLEGDRYIQSFVRTVQQHIREQDLFARLGGDEFCIVFENCPYDVAEQKIQEIRNIFSQESSTPYPKWFCYGILEIPQQREHLSISDMIQQVDSKMYLQKKARKNGRGQ